MNPRSNTFNEVFQILKIASRRLVSEVCCLNSEINNYSLNIVTMINIILNRCIFGPSPLNLTLTTGDLREVKH